MRILWRALLVVIAVVVAWRVTTIGLARYYADQLVPGETDSINRVLTWAPNHPRALLEKALTLVADEPNDAQRLLVRAYEADPTSALPLIALAALQLEQDEPRQADALVDIANGLEPVNPFLQKQIALYWDQRDNPTRALAHLSTLMKADASERAQIFPALLRIAENPQQRQLLEPFALKPPTWWDGFFAFAAQRALQGDTVRFLYHLRRQSPSQPITAAERSAYRKRLIDDGQIGEAYLVWVNGLDAQQRGALGLIYNGGFELPLGHQGFSWHARSSRRAEISTLPTKEARGQLALRLSFRSFDGRFAQLWQPLFLDAGTYRLSGRARSDNLSTQGGLRWQVSCLVPDRAMLGESTRFVGGSEWMRFSFDFEVPEECVYQQLQLVSAGRRSFELGIDGILWFDDLQIARTAALDAAARADSLLRGSQDAEPTPSIEPIVPEPASASASPGISEPPGEPAEPPTNPAPSETAPQQAPAELPSDPAPSEVPAGPAAPPPDSAPTMDSTDAEATAPSDVEPTADTPNGAAIELSFSAPCWVDIRDRSRNVLLRGEMSEGVRERIEGEPPYSLVLGNAAAVELIVAGEPYDLASVARGNVARFELDPTSISPKPSNPDATPSESHQDD